MTDPLSPSPVPSSLPVPAGLAERLSGVIAALPDAILCIDREWLITYANPEAIRISRLRPELFATLPFWIMFPETVGTEMERRYRSAMASSQRDHFEFYYPPFDVWVDVHILPTDEGLAIFYRDITEQKARETALQARETALREQDELLATVQRAARLATWELDLATGKTTFGPGSFQVFGHPLEEVTHLDKFQQILLPGHADRARGEIDHAIASGEVVVMEYAVTSADGSVVWIESRGQVVAGEATPRLRGMSIDITQRKLSEQNLVASEARYRVLADLNPHAIWMGDAEGNVTYANQGFLTYIGLTADNLNGLGWLEAFAPEDRDRVVEVWTRSVSTGVEYDIEAHLRNVATGEYRWWHLRAAAVRDASGTILHWLGVAYDVHDARTYADALRTEQAETERRRAELETVYTTTPVGLALLDPVHFTFLNLNDREAEMLGFPKEYILGRALSEIAPPASVPGQLEMLQSVAQGVSIRDRLLEGELPSRPGETRAWSVNYSPIYNEDGTIRAISTASIEITNQKKAESALIRSEKLAAVGRLASSISHEINNPLEAITNLLFLIALDTNLTSEVRSYVHTAQSELSRVSQIATQTLRFHRQAVAPTLVTASELVGAVVRLYTGRLANSNIKVDARYSTDTGILCFESDIRQVLNNLIANAIDAMRNGGRLVIRAHESSQAILVPGASEPTRRPGVRITIADTGHGMSPEVLARAFEPFFTTKDLNGTGLGLWISTGIVERHQGRLRVRSTAHPVHHGTVFTLFLPCEEVTTR